MVDISIVLQQFTRGYPHWIPIKSYEIPMENHHESPCFDQKLPAELINPSGVPGPAFDTLSIPIQSHTMVTNWYKGYGHPSSYSDYSGSINISLIYIYTYILYNIHIYIIHHPLMQHVMNPTNLTSLNLRSGLVSQDRSVRCSKWSGVKRSQTKPMEIVMAIRRSSFWLIPSGELT